VLNLVVILAKNIEENNDDSKSVEDALENVRILLIEFTGKVAAMEGELALFTTMLYNYDYAHGTDELLSVLKIIHTEFKKNLSTYCGNVDTDTIYKYLGKYRDLNESPSENLSANNETLENKMTEFKEIISSMIDVYGSLDVEIMPTKTWIQILDYRLPISMNIKFYKDNKNILKERKLKKTMSERFSKKNNSKCKKVEELKKIIFIQLNSKRQIIIETHNN